jgi:asparaginyl-tRNA synthetase
LITGPLGADEGPSARPAWKEPSKSALKKAQGALDSHRKKITKQHHRQQAAAEEENKKQAAGSLARH